MVNGFADDGIAIVAGSNNAIEGCYVGTNMADMVEAVGAVLATH